MRWAKLIYSPFVDDKIINVGNIMFEMDGVFLDIELIPDTYLVEHYGFTKEELYEMITNELEAEYYS
jgi:hypothetical protein